MADYINKNILSQAYIHIEPAGLETEEQLAEFNSLWGLVLHLALGNLFNVFDQKIADKNIGNC